MDGRLQPRLAQRMSNVWIRHLLLGHLRGLIALLLILGEDSSFNDFDLLECSFLVGCVATF
ncbi:hypothetical protein [Mesorhizobium sp. A556]